METLTIGQVDLLSKGVRAPTNLSSGGEKKSSLHTNLATTLVTQLLGSSLLEILGTEYDPNKVDENLASTSVSP